MTIAHELVKDGTGCSMALTQLGFIPLATRKYDVAGSEVMGEEVLDANLVVSGQGKEFCRSGVEVRDLPREVWTQK